MVNVAVVIERLLENEPCFDGRKWLCAMRDRKGVTVRELWEQVQEPEWRLWGAAALYPRQCRQVAEALLRQEATLMLGPYSQRLLVPEFCQNINPEYNKEIVVHVWSMFRLAVVELHCNNLNLALVFVSNAMALRLYGLGAMDKNFNNGLSRAADEIVYKHLAAAIFGDDQQRGGESQ